MTYGDLPLDAPEKPNKGHEGGACNRRACQAEPAMWWNHGSHSWYCADCARDIGDDPVNRMEWTLRWEPTRGHPMFETRDMMLERVRNGADEHSMPKVTFDSPVSADVIVEKLARTLSQDRASTLTDDDPRVEDVRRWRPLPPTEYPNRQQRRAAERAALKRR